MHILQDSFCLQYHSQECSIIIKEKQWVYITAQALISHLFLTTLFWMFWTIPPIPGLANHCWDKSAAPLHWTSSIKRKTKPSVPLPTAWKEVHIWPNTVYFYADTVKQKIFSYNELSAMAFFLSCLLDQSTPFYHHQSYWDVSSCLPEQLAPFAIHEALLCHMTMDYKKHT